MAEYESDKQMKNHVKEYILDISIGHSAKYLSAKGVIKDTQ